MIPSVLLFSDGGVLPVAAGDLLRSRNLRVVATSHPPDFERKLKDPSSSAVVVPARLVQGRIAHALAVLRAGPDPRPEVFALLETGETPPDGADRAFVSLEDAVSAVHESLFARFPALVPPTKLPADAVLAADYGPSVAEVGPTPAACASTGDLGAESCSSESPVSSAQTRRTSCGNPSGWRLAENARRMTELESDLDRLLDAALDSYLEAAGADRGSLLLSPEEGVLEVARRSGFGDDDAAAEAVEAVAAESARRSTPTQDRADGRIVLACPFTEGGNVLGVLVASVARDVDEDDRTAAALCARQAAASYANARRLEELRKMAVVDPLTGLFNRRFFERQLRVEIERARRHRRHLSLAIIDVDGFKRFNGVNGYDVGDSVIRETAEVLKNNFREIDVVTRWGGDEFAVILPETHRSAAAEPVRGRSAHFVDRVRKAVEAHRFRACPTGKVTISAGVAAYPGDAADALGLFQSANLALLEAKRTGHNRVIVVGPDGRTAAAEVS